jgi:hypothetical protein
VEVRQYREPYAVYDPVTGERIETSEPRAAKSSDMTDNHKDERRDIVLRAINALGQYAIRAPRQYAVLAYYMGNPCDSLENAGRALGVTKQAVYLLIRKIRRDYPEMAGILGSRTTQARAQQRRRNENKDR